MRRLLLVPLLLAACTRASSSAPDPARTVFGDEFDGPAIDRARWTVYTGQVYNTEQQAYVDDTLTARIVRGAEAMGADGGALLLMAHRRTVARPNGERADFVSARLHGRTTFTYGTAAARMRLPAGAGFWPAFWLLGEGAWPAHGEIDVMENVGDPAWVSVALHGPGYSGNTPLVGRDTLPPGFDATAWHVYAVDWTPAGVTFRVDGREIYRVSREEVARLGPPAAIDSAKYVILNLAIGGEYPAGVNGVRAPYLGLPEESARRLAAGEARVLVDWVRVTR